LARAIQQSHNGRDTRVHRPNHKAKYGLDESRTRKIEGENKMWLIKFKRIGIFFEEMLLLEVIR